MGPRLQSSQEQNREELRRLIRRQAEAVTKPAPMRYVWYVLIVGVVVAGAMDACRRGHEAQAAWRERPSADAVQLSGDYPTTARDWNVLWDR